VRTSDSRRVVSCYFFMYYLADSSVCLDVIRTQIVSNMIRTQNMLNMTRTQNVLNMIRT
jgi:hypothetical protein